MAHQVLSYRPIQTFSYKIGMVTKWKITVFAQLYFSGWRCKTFWCLGQEVKNGAPNLAGPRFRRESTNRFAPWFAPYHCCENQSWFAWAIPWLKTFRPTFWSFFLVTNHEHSINKNVWNKFKREKERDITQQFSCICLIMYPAISYKSSFITREFPNLNTI